MKHEQAFTATKERIVVPRAVFDGFITALHIQLKHLSAHQLKSVTCRYFFTLDIDKAIERISATCHLCASVKKLPHVEVEQTSGDPLSTARRTFAADIMQSSSQYVFVIRECITNCTNAMLVKNEQHGSIRDTLICLCTQFLPIVGPRAVIQIDSAPDFITLKGDELLKNHQISLDTERVKNIHKNPFAEKAIQELEEELVKNSFSMANCLLVSNDDTDVL